MRERKRMRSVHAGTRAFAEKDETCPLSTGGRTRRARLVQGERGGGGGARGTKPTRVRRVATARNPPFRGCYFGPRRGRARAHLAVDGVEQLLAVPVGAEPRWRRALHGGHETCPVSTGGWTRRVQLVREGGGKGRDLHGGHVREPREDRHHALEVVGHHLARGAPPLREQSPSRGLRGDQARRNTISGFDVFLQTQSWTRIPRAAGQTARVRAAGVGEHGLGKAPRARRRCCT